MIHFIFPLHSMPKLECVLAVLCNSMDEMHPSNCKAPPIYTIPRTSLHFGNDARSVQRKGMENVTTIHELIPRRLKKSRSRWVHEIQFPNAVRSGSKANHFTSPWSVVSLPVAKVSPIVYNSLSQPGVTTSGGVVERLSWGRQDLEVSDVVHSQFWENFNSKSHILLDG